MTQTDMEDAIKNLDRRMGSVEQILPMLATKEDLRVEILATRADLRAEILATRADLHDEILATRADLHEEIVATRRDLTERIEEVKRHSDARFEEAKRHADVLIEDTREDIRKVAEGVASLSTSLQANTRLLETVVRRLDRHDTILQVLLERGT